MCHTGVENVDCCRSIRSIRDPSSVHRFVQSIADAWGSNRKRSDRKWREYRVTFTLITKTRKWDSSWAPKRTERSVARSTVIFGKMGELRITRNDLSSRITRKEKDFASVWFSHKIYSIELVNDPNRMDHDFR